MKSPVQVAVTESFDPFVQSVEEETCGPSFIPVLNGTNCCLEIIMKLIINIDNTENTS